MLAPLLIANSGHVAGGGEIGLEMVAEALRSAGHDPTIGLPAAGPLGSATGAQRVIIGSGSTGIRAAVALLDGRVDLVHTFGSASLVHAAEADLGLPVVFHAVAPRPEPRDRWFAELAEFIICNSVYTADRFRGASGTPVRVVHNGIAAPVPRPAPLDLEPGRRHVGVIGQIRLYKGQLDLISAVAAIVGSTSDIDFHFVGDASSAVGYQVGKVADRHPGRIQLHGWVPGIANDLAAFELIVIPSRAESFCRVAVEALRCGTPVVARRVGALPEVLDGLRDPWLPTDRRRWAATILDHLDHPRDTPERLTAVGSHFGLGRFRRALADCYAELADHLSP